MSGPVLYRCRVSHTRTARLRNSFSYRHHMWLVDLDELPRLGVLARFEARDHLHDPAGPARSIRANLDSWLAAQGVTATARSEGGRVRMLSTARSLGYGFNPLSVFWCYRAGGELSCIVAEVHNTYGERHCYLLRPDAAGRVRQQKQFHVSPFFEVSGDYLMRFGEPGTSVRVTIALHQGDTTPFTATLRGEPEPARSGALARSTAEMRVACLRHPLLLALGGYRVWTLIRVQGLGLFVRRVSVVKRRPHVRQEGVS